MSIKGILTMALAGSSVLAETQNPKEIDSTCQELFTNCVVDGQKINVGLASSFGGCCAYKDLHVLDPTQIEELEVFSEDYTVGNKYSINPQHLQHPVTRGTHPDRTPFVSLKLCDKQPKSWYSCNDKNFAALSCFNQNIDGLKPYLCELRGIHQETYILTSKSYDSRQLYSLSNDQIKKILRDEEITFQDFDINRIDSLSLAK